MVYGVPEKPEFRGLSLALLWLSLALLALSLASLTHSCDYTRGLAAPTHIRLATARAVALL